MAYATHNPAVNGNQGGIARLIEGFSSRFARYSKYRRSVSELSALSNRELRDLGLHRSMIKSIAYEEAYGPRA